MFTIQEIIETIKMAQEESLDIRTITMGISLLECTHENHKIACTKIYDKITRLASRLVPVGEELEREFGIPIVNKRISVTPVSLIAGASSLEDYLPYALTMERRLKKSASILSADFALVRKGYTEATNGLSIPYCGFGGNRRVCASVNTNNYKNGNKHGCGFHMGQVIKGNCRIHCGPGQFWLCKTGCICQCSEDNPLAEAFHGVGEPGVLLIPGKRHRCGKRPWKEWETGISGC